MAAQDVRRDSEIGPHGPSPRATDRSTGSMTISLHQRIEERAYFIWIDEGRIHGRCHEYWLRAERELTAVAAKPIKAKAAKAATALAVKRRAAAKCSPEATAH
jgi:hypothetical protein